MKRFLTILFLFGGVLSPIVSNAAHASNAGSILLQVEQHGEAWYVDPNTNTRWYLQSGEYAYQALQRFGLGISNEDIWKIPVGILSTVAASNDVDGDGLGARMEDALGTNNFDVDTDDDGYSDSVEYCNGYSPFGAGRMPIDEELVDRLRGYILLQVQSHGEAWYVNPNDGKRYYMENGSAAYEMMRTLGLGITDENLAQIDIDPSSPIPPVEAWTTRIFSSQDLTLSIDLPSDSFVNDNELEDGWIIATILNETSHLYIAWKEGDGALEDFLGSTFGGISFCTEKTYDAYAGIECLGVTSAGMNAFMFESDGYTFMIIDEDNNPDEKFYGENWERVITSIAIARI